LQHIDNVISVLTRNVRVLCSPAEVGAQSYDFH
jgi:hypothetical protein